MSKRLQPAAFLDRDGTIIRQVELMHKPSDMEILPRTAEAIRSLNAANIRVIVVTNQPVVARGIATTQQIEAIHGLLQSALQAEGASIDAFYFCPHHPNATCEAFRQCCDCRKPNPGMLLKAQRDHEIDLSRSVMIGDTTQDILTGNRAGVRTILVHTGHAGKDPWQYQCAPDFEAEDLFEAAQLWLENIR